ncbi:MAG: hypothetical protein ACYCOR_20765 [Acidobacteriaceae bacterium]
MAISNDVAELIFVTKPSTVVAGNAWTVKNKSESDKDRVLVVRRRVRTRTEARLNFDNHLI